MSSCLGLRPVHRLHDLDDFNKTRVSLVSTAGHQLDARSELLEVVPLGCPKRMLPEERDDPVRADPAVAEPT